ncbi:olfactory receptor 14J1-like [Mycteria americana]|uniref:olfactory receptor 14J1-like n=1 Tax=Mycteria americana TaxID=33587 RepID=UPI003F58C4A1
MAYDRYIAICKPLHYGTLLGSRACVHMAAAAWGSGFLTAVLLTANTFSIPLCQGNALDQFFCEIPQILKLSCSQSYLREVGLIVFCVSLALGCFVFIVLSYVQIFRAVLRIPSEQGQHKAFSTSFSTCLPHLAVVSLFISTSLFAYLKPPSISSPSLDLVVAVLYSVVPAAVNPLIYSMRNQELKDAMKKLIQSIEDTLHWVCGIETRLMEGSRDMKAQARGGWSMPLVAQTDQEGVPTSPDSVAMPKDIFSVDYVDGVQCQVKDNGTTPPSLPGVGVRRQ